MIRTPSQYSARWLRSSCFCGYGLEKSHAWSSGGTMLSLSSQRSVRICHRSVTSVAENHRVICVGHGGRAVLGGDRGSRKTIRSVGFSCSKISSSSIQFPSTMIYAGFDNISRLALLCRKCTVAASPPSNSQSSPSTVASFPSVQFASLPTS